MRLAALDVAALLDQVADLVRRNGQLTLGANIESRRDQEVVAPSHPFGGFGLSSFWYSHDAFSPKPRNVTGGRKDSYYPYTERFDKAAGAEKGTMKAEA
jgi:hypothetical protein